MKHVVYMFDDFHVEPCGVAGVLVIHRGKVRFLKDRDQLILEVRVNGPVLVVQLSLIHVFSEDSPLLRGRRP